MANTASPGAVCGREHPGNLYYGHAGILKRHAGVRLPYRVPGVVQHGWVGDHPGICGDLSRHCYEDRIRRHFVWGRRNLARCRDYGYPHAVAIGAPFLYLGPPPEGALHPRGLFLSPAHSCEWTCFEDSLDDYRAYLDEIGKIRGRFDPIAASIYWYDLRDRRLVRLFAERGIRTVSFGDRNDRAFLRNFRRVVGEYAFMSSNVFCSALFYSLHLRRRAFVYGPRFRYRNDDPASGSRPPIHEQFSKIYPALLWENFDGAPHPEFAREELGGEFVRTPAGLRALMGWTPARLFGDARARLLPGRRLFRGADERRGMTGTRAAMGRAEFLGRRPDAGGVTLYFLARERLRSDFRIFAHAYPVDAGLLPPDRRPHGFFNLDHAPLVPARRWRRGRAYADAVDLSILPAGRYRLEVGLFDAGTGAALGSADAGAVEVVAPPAGDGGALKGGGA